MHNIDWPLAITLAVVFVVMSIVRWRYFRSVARRRARRAEESRGVDRTDPPAH
jgi:membrane protein implicated in regulation of membrane protease activity